MHITPVLLKNYSFHKFLNRSNFASFFSPLEMFMLTPWLLLER